jgi:tetratricopeptide (TPR) repeat protein
VEQTRSINVRFLCWLIAAGVILAVAVFSVHAYQMSRNANVFKRQAEEAEKENHFDVAARYYRLYMNYRPGDTEARRAWGQALDRKENKSRLELQQIATIFEEVLRHQEDNDLRRRLVDIYLNLRRFADVMSHLKVLLDKGSPLENDGELQQRLALCYNIQENRADAEKEYKRAIKNAPHHLPSYIEYADLLRRKKIKPDDEASADKIMLDMVLANQNNNQAHLERAKYLLKTEPSLKKTDRTVEAAKEIRTSYKLAPTRVETILAMTDLALSESDLKSARQYLEEGLKLYPELPTLYRTLSQVETRAQQQAEAIACLRRGLKAVKPVNQNILRYELALLLIQGDNIAEAEKTIEDIRKAGSSKVELDELNARILLHSKQWGDAANILQRIRGQVITRPEASYQVNLMLGL